MWKASLPAILVMYLFAQIRAASKASADNCSYSSDTRFTHFGNSSTPVFFLPRSKIRIFGSGTPRQNRDFGYGCSCSNDNNVQDDDPY